MRRSSDSAHTGLSRTAPCQLGAARCRRRAPAATVRRPRSMTGAGAFGPRRCGDRRWPRQREGGHHRLRRQAGQSQQEQGEEPLSIGLVLVLGSSLNENRHQHRGHDPAGEQVVHAVRERVGHFEHLSHAPDIQHRDQRCAAVRLFGPKPPEFAASAGVDCLSSELEAGRPCPGRPHDVSGRSRTDRARGDRLTSSVAGTHSVLWLSPG